MCIASRRAISAGPLARTRTPILFAGGWMYAASVSLSPCFSNRVAPRTTTFSPILPTSSLRSSSSWSTSPGPCCSTTSTTLSAKERNSSFFETGSVSHPTATSVPTRSPTRTRTMPSVVSRPARFPASAMPRSRRSFLAASRSPSASWRARFESIIPAPVSSRSCFTSVAGISSISRLLLLGGLGLGRALGLPHRLVLDGRLIGRGLLGRGLLGRGLRRSLRLLRLAVGRRGSLELLRAHLRPAVLDRLRDCLDHEAAGADRVVVPGDHVVHLVGVAVRVDEPDERQAKASSLTHSDLLLAEVDDEDRVGLALQVADAAEVGLELLELAEHRQALLRGQQVELALVLEAAQLVHPLDPARHRAPIREQPSEPAVVHVRHADAGRLLGDRVHRLLLRADEEHRAAAGGEVAREVVRTVEQLRGLLQVDDVDPAALGEDEPAHLRVPTSGLVAEMDTGLQKVSHRDDWHSGSPLVSFALQPAGRKWNPLRAGTATPLVRRVDGELQDVSEGLRGNRLDRPVAATPPRRARP